MTKRYFIRLFSFCLLFACCRSANDKKETEVLPFYNTADFTPQWISRSSPAYAAIHTIPAFRFVNQEGDTITEETVSGKIYVASFFFTACPGICKQLTGNLLLVQKAFKTDEKVLLISHSVTPENDNVTRLHQYAQRFGVDAAKWSLVTGNKQAIYQLARKAYFADEDMGEQKNTNEFLHTENLLLIDSQRRIRGVYKGTSVKEVNNLIADIKLLEAAQ